jgi:nucleoid-associated protein YgaU
MKKDAKIGLAIVLGALVISALLIGRALQEGGKSSNPDNNSDRTASADTSEGNTSSESESSSSSSSDAMDRLISSSPTTDSSDSTVSSPILVPVDSSDSPPVSVAASTESLDDYSSTVDPEVFGNTVGEDSTTVASTGTSSSTSLELVEGPTVASASDTTSSTDADVEEPVEVVTVLSEPEVVHRGKFVHTVVSGDSAWKLAQRFLGDGNAWKKIAAANPGVAIDRIKVGDKLNIPARGSSSSALASSETVDDSSSATVEDTSSSRPMTLSATRPAGSRKSTRLVSVRRGDSFYVLARRHLGNGKRYREIQKLNPELDARNLWVGQKILIPAR